MQNYIKRDFITDEDCAQSSECDVSKGLCCQLLPVQSSNKDRCKD